MPKRTRAKALVREAESVVSGRRMSPAARKTLTDAITQDLGAESEAMEAAAARLAKIETQLRVLAEAMIALADPRQNFALALRAVKENF